MSAHGVTEDTLSLTLDPKEWNRRALADKNIKSEEEEESEPVWSSGNANKQRDLGSNPLRLSFLFKSCGLWTIL